MSNVAPFVCPSVWQVWHEYHWLNERCALLAVMVGNADTRPTRQSLEVFEKVAGEADEQLRRAPLQPPRLVIKRRPPSIFDYQYEDFEIVNYQFHPAIKAPVASLHTLLDELARRGVTVERFYDY